MEDLQKMEDLRLFAKTQLYEDAELASLLLKMFNRHFTGLSAYSMGGDLIKSHLKLYGLPEMDGETDRGMWHRLKPVLESVIDRSATGHAASELTARPAP